MAISTKGIGQLDLSSGISSKNNLKSKDKEGAANSFSSLINMSSGNFKDDTDKISNNKLTNNVDSVNAADKASGINKTDDTGIKKSVDNKPADDKADVKDTSVENTDNDVNKKISDKEVIPNEKADSDKNMQDVTPDAQDVYDLAEKLASLINQITDILKDMLGIGDEELEENLSVLDMNFSDLLNLDNVNEFVLYSKGATEVDILIDEQLASVINDISEDISEIIASFDEFDIQAENIPVDTQETTYFVDMKDVAEKADEIFANPKEEAVKLPEEESKDEGSFIPKNVDNNISDAGRMMTFNTSSDNTGKNSSSQEFSSSNESVINNLNNAINNVVQENVVEANEFTEGVSQADIIRQVVDEIKANMTNEVQSLELRLNPESLGKVQITVSARNGIMQAQIIAETEAAKNAIEANIASLRETFNNQDLKVEAVEVTIAEYGFFEGQEQDMPDDNNPNKSNGRNINVNSGDVTDETNDDEQLETEIMRAQGNSVSYSI